MRRFAWLLFSCGAACGRLGFDELPGVSDAPGGVIAPDGGSNNDASADARLGSGAQGSIPVAHVRSDTMVMSSPGVTGTFSVNPAAPGDALVFALWCEDPAVVTGVALNAPGWEFTQLDLVENPGWGWIASFAALAPHAGNTTITYSWSSDACPSTAEFIDEFTNVDLTGGSVSFHDHRATIGNDATCTGSVTTHDANDTVWSMCITEQSVTSIPTGYAMGAFDLGGDEAAYRITTDPAGSLEPVVFVTAPAAPYLQATMTLKRR